MKLPDGEGQRRKDVINRHLAAGSTFRAAANELGIAPNTLVMWWRDNDRDRAVQTAMDAVGTGLVPHSMWTKVLPKDGGPGFSVYHKIEQPPEDIAERIRVALPTVYVPVYREVPYLSKAYPHMRR